MLQFASADELWKGFSNAPTMLCAILFTVLLIVQYKKKNYSSKWILLFACLIPASAIGITVHALLLPDTTRRILWVILYVFLYEIISLFHLLMMQYLTNGEKSGTLFRILRILQIGGVIASSVLACLDNPADIYIFAVYTLLLFVPVPIYAFRGKTASGKVKILMFILSIALVFQLIKDILPGPVGVVTTHIAVIIALYFVYAIPISQK